MEELNQHKQALERASENTEANEKIFRPGSHRPVRPPTQTGQTGRAKIEIPDRSLPESPQSKLQMVNLD